MMPICLSHHIFLFQSFSRKARYAPSWENLRHDSRESIASRFIEPANNDCELGSLVYFNVNIMTEI